MRVISQDGKRDVPYETSIFWIYCNSVFCQTAGRGGSITMGKYKSEEQASDALNSMLTYYCDVKKCEFLGMGESLFVKPFFRLP